MPVRYHVLYPTVPLSGQASDEIDVFNGVVSGVWSPVVTSCTLTLRGSFDSTSANYVPLTNPAGSGDWTFAVGPGSRGITLQDPGLPFPYLKLFTSVAQAAVRSFAVIVKL